MSIRLYKSYTPGTRNRALSSFSEITRDKPERSLVKKSHRNKGRNKTLLNFEDSVISSI